MNNIINYAGSIINTIKIYYLLLIICIIILCILLIKIKKAINEITKNIELQTQQLNALMTAEERNRIELQDIKKVLTNNMQTNQNKMLYTSKK